MARPGGARSFNNELIDLTMSDDEDTSSLRPAQNRTKLLPNPTAQQTLPAFPTSFDGLPDPSEFVKKERPQRSTNISNINYSLPQNGAYSPTTRPGTAPFAQSSRDHRSGNKRSLLSYKPNAQSSYPHQDENTHTADSSIRASNAMNAGVKRRRLEGEASQNLGQNARTTPSSSVAPSFPASPQLQNIAQSRKTLLTGRSRPAVVGGTPTVITRASRASRAEASSLPRISPNGRIQKPVYRVSDSDMVRVIENQVLAHVHAAVRPYLSTLNHQERSDIGKKVASTLVSGEGFVSNYTQNNKRLSPEYERGLAANAMTLVIDEVQKILDRKKAALDSSKETSPDVDASEAPSINTKPSIEQDFSECGSSADEELFEQAPLKGLRASISPTTSYSNDQTDAEASKDQRASNDVMNQSNSVLTRPMRARALKPDGSYKLGRRRRTKAEILAAQQGHAIYVDSSSTVSCAPYSPIVNDPEISCEQAAEHIVKPKRRRRTKAQMQAARALEQAGSMTSTQATSRSRQRRAEVFDSDQDRSASQTPLATGSSACPHGKLPPPVPVYYSQPAPYPLEDYFLRPYISYADRENLRRQLSRPEIVKYLSKVELDLLKSPDFHVDFSEEERQLLSTFLTEIFGIPSRSYPEATAQIRAYMKGRKSSLSMILEELQNPRRCRSDLLRTRSLAGISDFLQDVILLNVGKSVELFIAPTQTFDKPDHITALLRDREMYGMAPVRTRRGQNSCKVILKSHLEDSLVRQSEWTDCSGDISSITWTSPDAFIGGSLAHSDSHNMQYNKPGNLLLGSTSLDTIRAYPDHRIARPVIGSQENEENSLESMRTTQSPWLFTSVVSTAHCEYNGFSFTASFDGSVKVWSVSKDGAFMDLRGTWEHDGKVNFVATSPHHDRIATAFETNNNAVRIYNFDENAISDSPYDEYCGNKTAEQADELRRREKWAYQPATMQWGKTAKVAHLLLVGYSPRSDSGDEFDIPEDKRNSGELCLWNAENASKVTISSAKTQNVFEVIWHPTQPIFLAATSPCGTFDTEKTRTQVRLFAQTEHGTFTNIKTLDCPALDVNELTVMPNSSIECFVTASCTDGSTYVWDTFRGDQPIHVLQHGESLDNPDPDLPREVGDSGVKFAAWGQSGDRFYTGGSDGMVKAWNLKAPQGKAFVRNVLSISGGISTAVFNENCSKLLIGDATGKLYFLSIDGSDIEDDRNHSNTSSRQPVAVGSQLSRNIKRPKIIIPHAEPAPPKNYPVMQGIEQSSAEIAREYLARHQLRVFPNAEHPGSQRGVFQGPAYLGTGLFNLESHVASDGTKELTSDILKKQQFMVYEKKQQRLRLEQLPRVAASDPEQHQNNLGLEFDFEKLSVETQEWLYEEECELDGWDDYYFKYETCKLRFRSHKDSYFFGKKVDSKNFEGKKESRSIEELDESIDQASLSEPDHYPTDSL